MDIVAQLVTSFIASAGFGVLFNAPRQVIIQCGLVGMCGWILYFFLTTGEMNVVPATLLASILVGVLSHLFAKLFKIPIIIFYVSGIIPLVPGGVAYNAMRDFAQDNYHSGVELTAKVLLLAGSIAIGLMFSEVANKVIQKARR